MSSRSDVTPPESPHRHHRLIKWSLASVAAVVILAASAVGLFRIAANLVPRYHDLIAHQVAAQLGAPVRLGRISLAWHGLGPALVIRSVAVLGKDRQQTVFAARRVRFDFSLLELIHGTKAKPSGITVDAPSLTVERTADGTISIPGLELAGSASSGFDVSGMLGAAIHIHNGRLRFLAAGPAGPAWQFAPLDVDIGGGRRHSVRLSVPLPTALCGKTLTVDGTVATPAVAPGSWSWNASYSLPCLALGALSPFLPSGYPRVSGIFASAGALTGTGTGLETARGRIAVGDLAAGTSRVPHLRAHYRLAGRSGLALTLTGVTVSEPGRTWQPGEMSVSRDADGRLHATVGNIDLAALVPLLGFLPAGHAALVARIHAMAPRGRITDVRFAMTPGRTDIDLAARLADVTVLHAANAPGFEHLSGRASISHGVGEFDVDAPGLTLLMPHIFPHPVTLDRVSGHISVGLGASGLALGTRKLAITGPAGLAGELEGEIRIAKGGGVEVRMAATGQPIDVNPARRLYLPSGMLPKELDAWLMRGFDGGRVSGAHLEISGDVRRFPFSKGGGSFLVAFDYSGVKMIPGPQWEPLTHLAGNVRFVNAGLHANVTSGRVGGARVVKATADIADLFSPHLRVDAAVAGDASQFLAFLHSSPAAAQLQAGFDRLSATGPASARMRIQLPVLHIADFRVAGTLRLAGVTAHYRGFAQPLTALNGALDFDAKGPTSGTLQGQLNGTPVAISLSRAQHANAADIVFMSRLPVAEVSRLAGTDLSPYASGTLPLRATLSVPLSRSGPAPTLDAYSDLDGLAVTLPAPVGKQAAAKVPFAVHATIGSGSVTASARYGDVLSVCGSVATSPGGSGLRAADLALGAAECRAPSTGFLVNGGWQRLDLKPWLARLPHGAGKGRSLLNALALDLHFGELDAFSQVFRNLSIQGAFGGGKATLTIGGPDLAGKATIPSKPTNQTPIVVELTRGRFALPRQQGVVVAPASAAAPASGPAAAPQPAIAAASASGVATAAATGSGLRPDEIPPFVLHAAHLELGTAPLEDVRIVARQAPDGVIVDPVSIGGGALDLQGTLVWLEPPSGEPQGALHFVGKVDGLGKLLNGLGLGPVITGHGALSAGLAWHTVPGHSNFFDNLLGRVSVDLRDGSIAEANPGAGRLLSLLSLANIPRYLVFNFNNLFGKGFPFSRIHGDYTIEKGVAHTDGLFIDSSVAAIKLTGKIDLANETIDQTADVVPNYTGSLPIIGALFGGLGVGAAVFAITKIFGNPIAQATKLEYSITGPLAKPVMKPLGSTPPPKAGTRVRPRPAATSGRGS